MIVFFTDPHLGLRRQAHTTPASLKALRERLFTTVESLLNKWNDVPKICLGDWFDKSHNDEETLLRANALATSVELIVGGNHDMDNDKESVTSLHLLQAFDLSGRRQMNICLNGFGSTTVHMKSYPQDALDVYVVAHHGSQEMFETALEDACSSAAANAEKGNPHKRILLLHCNYDSPFAAHENTLNITEDDAEFLLEHFDYVMLGHEHQPRDLHGGRLIVLGNTHPTSFADISMKRVAIWENGELRFEEIWSPEQRYLKLDHSQIEDTNFGHAQFVHITGEIATGEIVALMRRAKQIWKQAPNLFMLRLDVKTAELERVSRDVEAVKLTLPQRIEQELAGDPASLALWKELTGEIHG